MVPARTLRERFPDHFLGWRTGFTALKKLGRADEADILLDEALSALPAQEWLASEALKRALQASHMQDVAVYGKALRTLAPENLFGWKAEINALRNLGLLDEVEKALEQADTMFPGEEWVLASAVSFSARRGDWQSTFEQAARLRQAFPTNEEGWIGGLRSLRHMKELAKAISLLKEAEAVQPGKTWLLIEAAHLAQASGDLLEAAQRWKQVRVAYPDRQEGYVGGVQVGLALGELNDAEMLVENAKAKFPQTPWLLSQAARIAQHRGDHEEAARGWGHVLAAYPDHEQAYKDRYKANRHLGRYDEADDVLRDALTRFPSWRWALMESPTLSQARYDFDEADQRWAIAAKVLPDDREIGLKYAIVRSLEVQQHKRDWSTTMIRLKELHQRYPDYVEGWKAHIYALRVQGKSRDAEELAAECLENMPDKPEIWLEYAFVAADQDAPERAMKRLADAAHRFKENLEVQNAFAESLARIGRLDEADQQYQHGLEQFPDSVDMACGYAAVAVSRQDWAEAMRRWAIVRQKFPRERRATQGLLDAHAALEDNETIDRLPAKIARTIETEYTDHSKLFWQFESLGGTGQGCEFGLVQRLGGGAEPLGLLRWSQIYPDKLIEALDCRFEGFGSPEQTFIDFYMSNDPNNPEYRCRDRRYETLMHTFIFKKDMSEEKMFKQTCRRMAFLRRKLIQDLEDGEKIFVYKIFHRNLEAQELKQLRQSMRTYGSNTLLYVRYTDEQHPSGTVVRTDDGLLVGYVERFSVTLPDSRPQMPDVPAWTAICKAALTLHNDGRQNAERVLEAQ